jgi:hypothetical protein
MPKTSETPRKNSETAHKAPKADSFPLDQRLGLDDGEFIRKGMERRCTEPVRNRLHDHHAQWRKSEAIAALAVEDHPLASAVRCKLFVHMQELFGLEHFNLRTHLVANRAETALAPLPAVKAVAEATTGFGKLHVRSGDGLAEMDETAGPGEEVSGAGQADGERIAVAFNNAAGEHVEELGMQWPGIEPEHHIGDTGTDQWDAHAENSTRWPPKRRTGALRLPLLSRRSALRSTAAAAAAAMTVTVLAGRSGLAAGRGGDETRTATADNRRGHDGRGRSGHWRRHWLRLGNRNRHWLGDDNASAAAADDRTVAAAADDRAIAAATIAVVEQPAAAVAAVAVTMMLAAAVATAASAMVAAAIAAAAIAVEQPAVLAAAMAAAVNDAGAPGHGPVAAAAVTVTDRGDVGRAAHRCHQHHSVHLDAPQQVWARRPEGGSDLAAPPRCGRGGRVTGGRSESSIDASADGPHTEKNVMPGGLGCNGKLGSLRAIREDSWGRRNDTPVVTVILTVPPRVTTGPDGRQLGCRRAKSRGLVET